MALLLLLLACGAGPKSDDSAPTAPVVPSTPTGSTVAEASRGCADPDPTWLLCEDFEGGDGDFDAFLAGSDFLDGDGVGDPGRITLAEDHAHGGRWAVHMPGAAESGYQGADLTWWSCDGPMDYNCPLIAHDQLYMRAWVRLAEDHTYVHHFLALEGSQPDDFWPRGTAGCLPNGEVDMGTTLDFDADHSAFFYTYTPDMACDTACERYADVEAICEECAGKGLPTCDAQPQCCWGNHYRPDTPVILPRGEWFCAEFSLVANTPGAADGSMAFWIDDALGHEATGLEWRTSPTLGLTRAQLRHYVAGGDSAVSNRVWFDDVVVSTERIGCE